MFSQRYCVLAAIAAVLAISNFPERAEGFTSPLHSASLLGLRHGSRSQRACTLSMKERPDGASEEQVEEAWKTYNQLMSTNNNGQGYWMDAPFQFFTNIKVALDRNFGGNKKEDTDFIDLNDSPFKPLIPADEMEELIALERKAQETSVPEFPVEQAMPMKKEKETKKDEKGKKFQKAAPAASAAKTVAPAKSSETEDLEKIEKKLADLDAAKKKAEAEAAAIKAKLTEGKQ